MKSYKPLSDRIIVFSVPYRQKLQGSVLFAGNPKRGSYQRTEEVWILRCGQLCKEEFPAGTHAWVADSFELEALDIDLWPEFAHDKAFEKLKEFVLSVEGYVQTSIITERSLLAVDDDYEATSMTREMPKD